MKAITICQPYAHLIERGDKPLENRTWWTNYRGLLAIHAGKSHAWLDDPSPVAVDQLVFGAIICLVDITACLKLDAAWPERYQHLQHHEHANGPWCHIYENVQRLHTPIPCRGAQGLWQVPKEIIQQVVWAVL